MMSDRATRPEHVQSLTQWGVRYGDGEVEGPFNERRWAELHLGGVRKDIADGHVEADDYEPMEVVARVMTIATAEWAA